MDLQRIRSEYVRSKLDIGDLLENPREQFRQWLDQALEWEVMEATAMTLSTVSENNRPSSRTVLLKEMDNHGLIFYTNYSSSKARDMDANPHISLLFFWKEIERQVRIEGYVEKVEPDISTTYFQSRPRASQIGAWASPQSEIIENRDILLSRINELESRFEGASILPRPEWWGGYRCIPSYWEFWQGRENRIHDRFSYKRSGDKWQINRLAP